MNQRHYILQFTIGDHVLGCQINNIQKILPMMTMEEIADGSDSVIGLINVGGRTITIFDMAVCLQIKPRDYSEDTSILLTQKGSQPIGFIVDVVQDLVLINDQDFHKETALVDTKHHFYSGSVLINEKPCLIVALDQLAQYVM